MDEKEKENKKEEPDQMIFFPMFGNSLFASPVVSEVSNTEESKEEKRKKLKD